MSYLYRMAYPIVDDSLRTSQVINQATLIFPEDAEERGFKLTSEPRVWIDGAAVNCEAEAELMEGRRPHLADVHGWRVAALKAAGMSDVAIATQLGLKKQTVQRIRTELGLPAIDRRAS